MSNTTLRCDSYNTHNFLYDYTPAPAVDFTNGMASSTPIDFGNITDFASEVEIADYAIPILIMVLGIVSVVLFQIMLFFRCCCSCMKCGPDTFNHNKDGWQTKIVRRRKLLFRLFYLFVIAALISDQITLFGSGEIDYAVENTQRAILNLRDITSTSIASVSTINQTKYLIDAEYATSACYGGAYDFTLMRLNLTNAPIESFISMTDNFPDTLTDAEETLGDWGVDKKNSVVYVFYVFILLICFLFFISPLMQLKKLLQLCILISEIVIVALSIVFAIEMILLVSLTVYIYVKPNLSNIYLYLYISPLTTNLSTIFYSPNPILLILLIL